MADSPPELTTLPVREMKVCLKELDGVWDIPEREVYSILIRGAWITFDPEEYETIKAFIESQFD